MSEKMIYALNTVSGRVVEIRESALGHPTFGKNYIQVENPDVCIGCGVQPDEVTPVDAPAPAEDPGPEPRKRKPRTKNKE